MEALPVVASVLGGHCLPIDDLPLPLLTALTTLTAAVSPETPRVDGGRAAWSEASTATVTKHARQMIDGVAMTPDEDSS
jgi:hypothetical protein